MHHKRRRYRDRRNTYARREHERRYGKYVYNTPDQEWQPGASGHYVPGIGAEGNTPKASHGNPGRPYKRMWAKQVRRRQDRMIDRAFRRDDFDNMTIPRYQDIANQWDFY